MINLHQPWWLLLALQPVLLWLLLQFLQRNKQQKFADDYLLPWITANKKQSIWQRFFSRNSAYFLAWIGFSLALAGPQVPDKVANNNEKQLDIMLVMDLSHSMNAEDIKPSRMRRSVLEAYEFLSLDSLFSSAKAKVGVVVYAARPHVYVPVISDLDALKFYLKDVDSLQMPTQGSDHVAALALAQDELLKLRGENKSIIWFTDGDFQDEEQLARIEKIVQSSIKMYILGIGTEEGAAIPLPDGTWLTENGQAVVSKLKADLLHKIAKKGGGVLSIVKDNESDWEKIIQNGIVPSLKASLLKADSKLESNKQRSIMIWFLLPACLLLFLALFPSLKAFLVLLLLSSLVLFSSARADDSYLETIKQGALAYQAEDYYFAKRNFMKAVLSAKTKDEQAVALHNLGNVLFKMGDYDTASELFTDALRYNANQNQSQKNQVLSKTLFKALQRQLRNQQGQGNSSTLGQNSLLFDLPNQLNPSSSSPSQNTEAEMTTGFVLPELPKKELNSLLAKGLAQLNFLQKNEGSNVKEKQENSQKRQEINEARFYLLQLEEQTDSSSTLLWKRLFEIEEGFAGKLKAPEEVPGIHPW